MKAFNWFRRENHKITLIAEFRNQTKATEIGIAKFTKYISSIIKKKDSVYLNIESNLQGYRLTYIIDYSDYNITNKIRKKYHKKLSNLYDWLYDNSSVFTSISNYQFNHIIIS